MFLDVTSSTWEGDSGVWPGERIVFFDPKRVSNVKEGSQSLEAWRQIRLEPAVRGFEGMRKRSLEG